MLLEFSPSNQSTLQSLAEGLAKMVMEQRRGANVAAIPTLGSRGHGVFQSRAVPGVGHWVGRHEV